MPKNIHPLGHRVLIKRNEVKTTKGGIILPETAQEKPRMGEVIAVGEGRRDEEGNLQPLSVQVGDQVLFGAYAGTEVKTEDVDHHYLIVSEDDILGVLYV